MQLLVLHSEISVEAVEFVRTPAELLPASILLEMRIQLSYSLNLLYRVYMPSNAWAKLVNFSI
jgi:hypothetical protein